MAETNPTTGDLLMSGLIAEADVAGAVDRYWHAPETSSHPLGDAYVLNLAQAVQGSPEAGTAMSDAKLPDIIKRSAVRTAILLARPAKA